MVKFNGYRRSADVWLHPQWFAGLRLQLARVAPARMCSEPGVPPLASGAQQRVGVGSLRPTSSWLCHAATMWSLHLAHAPPSPDWAVHCATLERAHSSIRRAPFTHRKGHLLRTLTFFHFVQFPALSETLTKTLFLTLACRLTSTFAR